MTVRTTPEQVATIVQVDITEVDLTAFILTANELVTEVCAPQGYSDARLELIERYLAGHFYIVFDAAIASEAVSGGGGGAQQSFQYKNGLILQGSAQGQSALAIDTKGGLAALSKAMEEGGRRKVTFYWVGGEPCES